jgi:hypothetical protein
MEWATFCKMRNTFEKENKTLNLKTFRSVTLLGAAIALVGGLPLAIPAAAADGTRTQESQEASRLLREARTSARKLAVTTDQFQSYTRSKLNWRTHTEKAHQVKTEVNALGATVQKLEALKAEAAPWQQEAIQNIKPIAMELAQNTEFVIQHIRDNPQHLSQAEYQEALANKSELASQLAEVTGDFVSYGETKRTLEELGTKLEVN